MTDIKKYKVLARKYRPTKFEDLIGQDTLVQILTNSIKNNRIAYSYILTGVRGVGKTTTARLLAKSLNCKDKLENTSEPCDDCESCNSISSDNNLDVIEMDGASKTGIDDIREIIENVKYKPVNSPYKIFIIDEVHMLSKSAFNALLKTLEEPPEHVKFIFATTDVKKIPITILSRCQRFDLHRIENKVLTLYLKKIANLEKVKINDDAIALIVRAADGSVRDGLSLFDQAITDNQNVIDSKTISSMLGLADRGKIYDLLEQILEGKAEEALIIYKDLYNSGSDIVLIFDEMLNAVHFFTQLKISPELKNNIYIPELERTKGLEISSKLTMSSLGIIWQILFKGYQELQSGLHLFQHGEMIILRLIFLHDGPGPQELLDKSNSNNEETNSSVLNKNDSIDVNKNNNLLNEKQTNKKNGLILKTFRELVELFYYKKEGLLHAELYNNVKLISFEEGKIIINNSGIKDKNFNRIISKLISKWTGRIWQVHSSTSNLGISLFEEDILIQQKEIEKMKNNPEIMKIYEEFPGVKIHSITNISETSEEKNFEKKLTKKGKTDG